MISADFDLAYEYVSTGDGIPVPVRIGHAGKTVELTARLDTGAAHCLFHRSYADLLDIDWDQGLPQNYRTGAGNFRAYGHELALNTWGLQWSAMVYFHEAGSPNSNYVGRTGWLDRVRSWALARNYPLCFAQHNGYYVEHRIMLSSGGEVPFPGGFPQNQLT